MIFSAWICPFELAFLRNLPNNLYIADNVVNTFFAIDIVLTFFVAYLDKETYLLIDDPKRIAARYIFSVKYFMKGICFCPYLLFYSQSNSNLASESTKGLPLFFNYTQQFTVSADNTSFLEFEILIRYLIN